jgi:hypothetical protein
VLAEVVEYTHVALVPDTVMVVDPMPKMLIIGELVAETRPSKLNWKDNVSPTLMRVDEAAVVPTDVDVAFNSDTVAAEALLGAIARAHTNKVRKTVDKTKC